MDYIPSAQQAITQSKSNYERKFCYGQNGSQLLYTLIIAVPSTTPPLPNTTPPLFNTTPLLPNTTPPLPNTTPPLPNLLPQGESRIMQAYPGRASHASFAIHDSFQDAQLSQAQWDDPVPRVVELPQPEHRI